MTATQTKEEAFAPSLWNGGLSCDGYSVALAATTRPSIEGIPLGALLTVAEMLARSYADIERYLEIHRM